jgi:hypothetical protein
MSITLRPSDERGQERRSWLHSRHSFSFGSYFDPAHMGFRSLRVINEDIIAGGGGFATHPHHDMEIVSYVVEGALAHRDSTGSEGVIRRGDVQAMSAGTGVQHSEFNNLADRQTRFLQIWILPERKGLPPGYQERSIPELEKRNRLRLLAGPEQRPDTVTIHQDALIFGCLLEKDRSLRHPLAAGRGAWLQLIDGALSVNGTALASGDGARLEELTEITIAAQADSEFLLFDLA